MAVDRIEALISRGEWELARANIEEQLQKERDDHWLWSRFAGVKYEQRDYKGALAAAKKALKIIPDCPLALWSYAGALDMLGKTREAGRVYSQLIRRGVEELKTPDADADECWEGDDWTRGLVVDCLFRIADCLAKLGKPAKAVECYKRFLTLLDWGVGHGIYSREDAVARLKELDPGKKAIPDDVQTAVKGLEGAMR